MIEAVQSSDLEFLRTLREGVSGDRLKAITLIGEIMNRMERPRAYLLAPPPTRDEALRTWWQHQVDITSASMTMSGYSIVEADTIVWLITFCPALQEALKEHNPLYGVLAGDRLVEEVWVPVRMSHAKRYKKAIDLARHSERLVVLWHPKPPPVRPLICRL